MAEQSKNEWSKYGEEFCGTIYYDKGDKEYHLTAAFNMGAKNIDIWGDRWESNGTPVLVPQDHPTRWSCEYGHFSVSIQRGN